MAREVLIALTPEQAEAIRGGAREMRRPVESLQASTRRTVTADLAAHMPENRHMVAHPGARDVQMNRYGATSVLADDGRFLGVKPGEFDFVCPFAEGRTYLDRCPDGSGNGVWRIDVAHDQRLRCATSGFVLVVTSACLLRWDEQWWWGLEFVLGGGD